jgi:hypothetical protein
VDEEGSEEAKDRLAQRQARAAIALLRLGDADEVWPEWHEDSSRPSL